MNPAVINPYIRLAMQSVLPKGHRINQRIIYDYELIYIADGSFILCYDGIDYLCQKGQFILLRPGISHSFSGIDTDLHQPHIHFDLIHQTNSPQVPICFKDMDQLSPEEKAMIREDIFRQYPQVPLIAFFDQKAALSLFYRIVNPPQPTPLTQKAFLMQLLDMLIGEHFPELLHGSERSISSIEVQMKHFIDAGQGLSSSLDDLARQFNYSKYHLERRFKARYGTTPMAYRNKKRLELAKELLKQESVSRVSEKLGFSSIYAFSRAFKNHFGFSPNKIKTAD